MPLKESTNSELSSDYEFSLFDFKPLAFVVAFFHFSLAFVYIVFHERYVGVTPTNNEKTLISEGKISIPFRVISSSHFFHQFTIISLVFTRLVAVSARSASIFSFMATILPQSCSWSITQINVYPLPHM
jgi:uncharacterized membrane protein